MNFFVTLYIWTVVAATPGWSVNTMPMSRGEVFRDWRASGEFRDVAACERGAKALGLKPDAYRCIRKDGA
jgi:hypothetical protein